MRRRNVRIRHHWSRLLEWFEARELPRWMEAPGKVSPRKRMRRKHGIIVGITLFGFLLFLQIRRIVLCTTSHQRIPVYARTGPTTWLGTMPGLRAVTEAIPPLLLQPPQHSNGFRSFEEQCVTHCISAYHASPHLEISSNRNASAPSRLLHFIFIGDVESEFHVSFTFMDYMTIRSAYFRLQPQGIYLHTNMACQPSPLWDLIRPMITHHEHLEPITEIFGNKVTGRAHFSDIARLQVLQKFGGIYMDIDSLSLRPFTEEMWNPPSGLAMGHEDSKRMHIGCGVIIAQRSSLFLTRWLESYKTFNDKKWAEHTVIMAGYLAREFPHEINVFPETYFYRPSWRPGSIEVLWNEHAPDDIDLFEFPHAYAPHYWGTLARSKGYVSRMTPSTILNENVAIHQMLRAILPSPYFSLVVNCNVGKDEFWKVQNTLQSIIDQSFVLWEVVLIEPLDANGYRPCSDYTIQHLVPQIPRLRHHREKSIRRVYVPEGKPIRSFTKGIWMIELDAGSELISETVLDDALVEMKLGYSFVHYTTGKKKIQFVFDHTRGMTRLANNHILPYIGQKLVHT